MTRTGFTRTLDLNEDKHIHTKGKLLALSPLSFYDFVLTIGEYDPDKAYKDSELCPNRKSVISLNHSLFLLCCFR